MAAYILRRAVQAVVVLLLVTFIVFALMRLLPGDPILVYISQDEWSRVTSKEEIDALRHEYGTDRPIVVQYVDWLGGVLQGDLGESIFLGTEVKEEIARALPVTLYLGVLAWLVAHLFGLPAGVICAVRHNGWQDTLLTFLANIGMTVPIFWLGILMIVSLCTHIIRVKGKTWVMPAVLFVLSVAVIPLRLMALLVALLLFAVAPDPAPLAIVPAASP